MSALVIRNVSKDAVELGEDFLLPNQTLSIWPTRYLWDDCGLRQLIADGLLKLDPDREPTVH